VFGRVEQCFLQDAAAMIGLNPERANHPTFKEKNHMEKMSHAIQNEDDLVDTNLEKVLPCVC